MFTSSHVESIIQDGVPCIANDICGSKCWDGYRVFEYSIPHIANQTSNKKRIYVLKHVSTD